MKKIFLFAATLFAASLSLNAQTLQSGSFLINLPELKTATKTADGIYDIEIQPLQVTDLSTNQTVEYALNETGDFYDPAATVWQDSPVFPAHATTGAVYLLARSKQNATHKAGVIYHHAVYLDGKCNCSLGLTLPPIAPPPPPPCEDQTFTVNGVSFTMKCVEGGTYTMGCTAGTDVEGGCWTSENPAHSVTLDKFYMGETEVTQALWEAVMGSVNGSGYGVGADYPVYRVSWNTIVGTDGFLEKLNAVTGKNFVLPSESQWEYAARGGQAGIANDYAFSGGNTLSAVGWYEDNRIINGSHTVKGAAANELGIYDMSGNLWEWCQDVPSSDYSSTPVDGSANTGNSSLRIIRGGSWNDDAWFARVSLRNTAESANAYYDIGFRLLLPF